MSADRPLSVVIGALGGQGGGVLADWLVEAARLAGYPAQGTSIPGVAQRTGATTYYFEIFPDKNPPGDPVFCLFPSATDVDLVAALEPTEAGRALERGHVTGGTTVITADIRIFSTAEKIDAGDGTIPVEPVIEALEQAAGKVLRLDMQNLGAGAIGQANAILFGGIAGSGVLPLTADDCRAAIEAKGVAVESNLAGFHVGLDATAEPAATPADAEQAFDPPPADFTGPVADLPETLRPLAGHALARLVDYQDAAYGRLYLDRLRRLIEIDKTGDYRLSAIVARRLAAWMSFEDVVRVAQLKTRPGRLTRIRGEVGLTNGGPLRVYDYLKPGREELISLMPPALARWVPKEKEVGAGKGWRLHMPTASAFGFAAMKMMAGLRPLRRHGVRFHHEQAAIEAWLTAVVTTAKYDFDLASEIADLAIWVRGYGDVRGDGMDRLDGLFDNLEDRLREDRNGLAAEIDAALAAARTDPDQYTATT
jgi:indolepyruvate ferredoxin oxidoreductase, beta subunit